MRPINLRRRYWTSFVPIRHPVSSLLRFWASSNNARRHLIKVIRFLSVSIIVQYGFRSISLLFKFTQLAVNSINAGFRHFNMKYKKIAQIDWDFQVTKMFTLIFKIFSSNFNHLSPFISFKFNQQLLLCVAISLSVGWLTSILNEVQYFYFD